MRCGGTISIRLVFMAMPPTPRAEPITAYSTIAATSQCETGAQTTVAAMIAMENATDLRPPRLAITAGAYNALRKAPVPHPALSHP